MYLRKKETPDDFVCKGNHGGDIEERLTLLTIGRIGSELHVSHIETDIRMKQQTEVQKS
jgi:hypothetical protein